MNSQGRKDNGFTRTDLLTTVGLVVVCAAMANQYIVLVNPRTRADALVCQANLAHIGRAYQLWATDHGDRNPFQVSSNAGGLFGVYLAHNAWYQYAWISNELSTAKVLVCPADTNTTRVARDFSANPDGGFAHPGYRNNAISYMVGIHAEFYIPSSVLSADRNIEPVVNAGGCAYAGLQAAQALQSQTPTGSGGSSWGNSIHVTRGNLLFSDGSVQETTSVQLRLALVRTREDDGFTTVHSIYPR